MFHNSHAQSIILIFKMFSCTQLFFPFTHLKCQLQTPFISYINAGPMIYLCGRPEVVAGYLSIWQSSLVSSLPRMWHELKKGNRKTPVERHLKYLMVRYLRVTNGSSICATYSAFQPVARAPPVVLEGVPGGPQLNDGELLRVSSETKWTCYKLHFKGEFQGKTFF